MCGLFVDVVAVGVGVVGVGVAADVVIVVVVVVVAADNKLLDSGWTRDGTKPGSGGGGAGVWGAELPVGVVGVEVSSSSKMMSSPTIVIRRIPLVDPVTMEPAPGRYRLLPIPGLLLKPLLV